MVKLYTFGINTTIYASYQKVGLGAPVAAPDVWIRDVIQPWITQNGTVI